MSQVVTIVVELGQENARRRTRTLGTVLRNIGILVLYILIYVMSAFVSPDLLIMAEYRKLDNPPIVEAVIDFRVRRRAKVSAEELLSGKQALESLGFPHLGEQQSVEVTFSNAGEQRDHKKSFLGHRFVSENGERLVHFQIQGFAYNVVGGYISWEKLVSEALELWEIYQDAANPLSIVRIGVRFINRLPQSAETSPNEVRSNPSKVLGIPDHQYRGSQERVLIERSNGIRATFVQTVNYAGGPFEVIIDTDSYQTLEGEKEIELPVPSRELIERLKPLRDLKNDLFFKSVKESALTPYMIHES